jgi:A32 protein
MSQKTPSLLNKLNSNPYQQKNLLHLKKKKEKQEEQKDEQKDELPERDQFGVYNDFNPPDNTIQEYTSSSSDEEEPTDVAVEQNNNNLKKEPIDCEKNFKSEHCNKIDLNIRESEYGFDVKNKGKRKLEEMYVPEPTVIDDEGLRQLVYSIIMRKQDENPNEGIICTFYGKRRTGKSFCLRNLMSVLREVFPFGIVMSKTAFNQYWQHHVPKKYVHDNVNREVLYKLLSRQQRITQELDDHPELRGEVNPKIFLILDDVVMDKRIKWMTEIDTISTAGRHYNISTFVTTQTAKGMNPVWRNNTDLAFILKQMRTGDKESLFEDYGLNLNKQEFYELLARTTKDNGILIVNTAENSGEFNKTYYCYKAENPGEFMLGCQEFWKTDEKDNLTKYNAGSVFDKDYKKTRLS